MFSYKSYLLLGALAQQGINIPFLTEHGYELSKCDYAFARNIDQKGEVQSKTQCNNIALEFLGVPSNEIVDWAINPRKYHDGAIIFCNSEGTVLEKINFYRTACIYMDMNYIDTGSAYTSCSLILSPKTLKIGRVEYTSEWINA